MPKENLTDSPRESVVHFTEILTGPKGDKGDRGLKGDKGDPGPTGTAYRHVQSVAASVWTVVHNLGYKPGTPYAQDSGGNQIIGRIHHVDENSFTISYFSNGAPAATGGEVYVS